MNWAPSDRAVCIRSLPWHDPAGNVVSGPIRDTIYLVNAVISTRHGPYLSLAGWSGWWDADEFRRIVPKSEQTEVAEEVAA